MIVTVFRSRLRPGVRDEYVAMVEQMARIARTMPGYLSHKGFFADDGERVTIVEFESEEGMRAWRTNPEHRAAQRLAREKYYTAYHIQVCTLDRETKFEAPAVVAPEVVAPEVLAPEVLAPTVVAAAAHRVDPPPAEGH